MKINRIWAMPNKWTFKIKPIADLLTKYVGDGKGWIDPFAGENSPAEITNDLNPEMPTTYHMDAFDLAKVQVGGRYKGVIFDPPYSLDQIARSYENVGLKSKLGFSKNGALDPTGCWRLLKDDLACIVVVGGLTISFGWNSNGFGKTRGFEIVEILLVAHGSAHNDTIVTVERKVQASL